ncbi:biotin/lipoate A/B protein ligase family protein [Paenibacillus sp. sgz500958]|uniref:lipoate--protein ligase family protein n=1 Tax=Paenibacillus sp. sgz500958 TaxID=3242475 RepID=UPI0036D3D5F0
MTERTYPLSYTELNSLPPELGLFEHGLQKNNVQESVKNREAGADGMGSVDMLSPFAFEETLCRDIGAGLAPPSIHLWSHPSGVVLGLRDSKLPCARQAMNKLEEQGVYTAVRHSGGAAVPLDAGIVNVSLLLPKSRGKLDFHDDFRLLSSLITEAVAVTHPKAAAQIEAGEIVHSYCPGDFDLSIGGRKFCGIAQRRQSSAYFVHAFVVVSGSGKQRGELIRNFYADAVCGQEGLSYPDVHPESIAALGELGGPDAAEVFTAGIKEALEKRGIRLRPASALALEMGYSLEYGDERVREAAQVLRERYAQQ